MTLLTRLVAITSQLQGPCESQRIENYETFETTLSTLLTRIYIYIYIERERERERSYLYLPRDSPFTHDLP